MLVPYRALSPTLSARLRFSDERDDARVTGRQVWTACFGIVFFDLTCDLNSRFPCVQIMSQSWISEPILLVVSRLHAGMEFPGHIRLACCPQSRHLPLAKNITELLA